MAAKSLTKMLERREAVQKKMDDLMDELIDLDRQIFPRVRQLAAAIDGGDLKKPSRVEKEVENLFIVHPPGQRPRPKLLVAEIEKVMKQANRPMKTAEILEALKSITVQVNGKNPLNNLAAHLSHHKAMFVSTVNGWSLRSVNLLDSENTNAHASH